MDDLFTCGGYVEHHADLDMGDDAWVQLLDLEPNAFGTRRAWIQLSQRDISKWNQRFQNWSAAPFKPNNLEAARVERDQVLNWTAQFFCVQP